MAVDGEGEGGLGGLQGEGEGAGLWHGERFATDRETWRETRHEARHEARYVADLVGVNLLRGVASGGAVELEGGGRLEAVGAE